MIEKIRERRKNKIYYIFKVNYNSHPKSLSPLFSFLGMESDSFLFTPFDPPLYHSFTLTKWRMARRKNGRKGKEEGEKEWQKDEK